MTDGARHEIGIRMPYLRLIASGIKTVEVRVGYPRMRKILVGQERPGSRRVRYLRSAARSEPSGRGGEWARRSRA